MTLPPVLRVVESTPWRIILEEETGMPGGKLFQIVPVAGGSEPQLVIDELRPREVK